MQYRRIVTWISLLLVLMLVVSGCAPRPSAGDTAAAAAPDAVVIDLPSIALDVAQDGSLSLGGIPLAELAAGFGMPADLGLDPAQITQITGAGIQHIQVENRPNGLGIFINGQEIPALGWSGEELTNVAGLMGNQPALSKLLPLLTQLGIGVTLRFPVAEGAEPAPLLVEGSDTAAAALTASQEKFVEAVGTAPTISVPVLYNDDGSWSVAGVSGDEWINLTGQTFWTALDLTEKNIADMKAAGIKSANLGIDTNGLHLTINDTDLPSIDWSGGKLASVITLLQDSGMLNIPGLDPAMLQTLLDQFLPILTSSNVNITVTFPE